jgi:16S rRNA (cytosine1402-N4)-methyltransferase
MSLAAIYEDGATDRRHVPVMVEEVCGLASAHGPLAFVDVTVGAGGHAAAIMHVTGAKMLGLDRDEHALEIARENLAEFGDRVTLKRADFGEIKSALHECGFAGADLILADLGMSSLALDDPARGFSFRADGPLDMRMDNRQQLRARDLVNEESETELARIIYTYGEERASRRIARLIVDARRRQPIETTGELRTLVERAVGGHRRTGVHPATKTFQALRIAVNREMESLAELLRDGPAMLNPRGRMIVIAYHSLEDRPVKERFRELTAGEEFLAVTRKVVKPTGAETSRNPRARSARIRCIERSAP